MIFNDLLRFYRHHLLDEVMPFWVNHAVDVEHGGLFTGINDDGTVATTDKFLWSNARAIYTFSALYNYAERSPKWLSLADNVAGFCMDHALEKPGVWGYLADRTGTQMKEGATAIQVDAFAMMGLSEYIRATGNPRAVTIALETYDSTRQRLAVPGSYGTFPYPIPEGTKAHRDYFQFALAYYQLSVVLDRPDILAQSLQRANAVMDSFRRPERQALLEYTGLDDVPPNSPAGRCMVPGHAIESMWFLIHIFAHVGDARRIRQCVEVIRWSVEKGWDPQFGGLFLGIDLEAQSPPFWGNPEKKLWWVHCEALYALLLAFEHTHAGWTMEWYWKIHDWTFAHFPVARHGEWTNRLDRQGARTDTVVALPVKDPFHLPRALIMCIEVLKRLATAQTPVAPRGRLRLEP